MTPLLDDGAGGLEIDFGDASMDEFLRVAAYLEGALGAEPAGRIESPGEAYRDFRLDGVRLTLHHHAMANVLYAAEDSGRAALARLFPLLTAADF